MRPDIIAAGLCILCVVIGVRAFEARSAPGVRGVYTRSLVGENDNPAPAQIAHAARNGRPAAYGDSYARGWGYEVRIRADRDRQYRIDAGVNRRATHFLVDTGAALVALRESDARSAGVFINPSDFKAPITTANGQTYAARVKVDEIEIQGLRVRNVDAFVLPDEKLSINLLGMSFLSRLESVETRNDEMIMRG